jgi:iron-sulfur cluster assembly protein
MAVTGIMQAPVTFSERAAIEIKAVLAREERANDALRVFIAGAGCSGLQYGMGIEETAQGSDTEFVQHGLRVVIDAQSLEYMQGASVEFVEDENGGGFRIENPNAPSGCSSCASSGCGCGE